MAAPRPPGEGVHVIVPVKGLAHAKTRFASRIGPDDRRDLVLAMLVDTLDSLGRSATVSRLCVVTPDADVARHSRVHGAEPIAEIASPGLSTTDGGLNRAIGRAVDAVAGQSHHGVLAVVQADLPALRPDEFTGAVEDALTQADGHSARAFVADHAGTGTTALLACGDGTRLRPQFGAASAEAHRRSGAVRLDGCGMGLRCDVDTPGDLLRAQRLGLGPATAAVTGSLRPLLRRSN